MDALLSTDTFYGMIMSGAKQVINDENKLNELNVFPVADKDTGTNLASMMRYIVDNLSLTKDTPELLHQLAQHGLVGCSGNSGLIFSQFFYGLTQHSLTEKTLIKLHDFVEMISKGYQSAYASVSNPKPGTILTVMEKWVESYRDLLKSAGMNLADSFKSSVEKSRVALKETMNQLEVLRNNHVVDAGAQGFVTFLEGMLGYLVGSKDEREKILAGSADTENTAKLSHEFEDVTEVPDLRYCFETVVRTAKAGFSDEERKKLDRLGDSIVVGKGPQMLKLHIHTNEPDTVTSLLAETGDILYQKIDDMMLQYNIAHSHSAGNKIALVVDTMADLPLEFIQSNNIYRIPLQVKVNNHSFLDQISINYHQILDYLNNNDNKIGTAAPSAAIVSRALHFLEQFYDSIIIITVGSSLSSTYDVIANQAAKFKHKKISVIDSKLNSAPLSLLVTLAAQMIKDGSSHDAIVKSLNEAKANANILIVLNSLKGLIRSGRLSKSMGMLAGLFRLKPIIQIDVNTGKPKVIGASFSKRGGWKKICKKLNELKNKEQLKSIAVVHSDSDERAKFFGKYINRKTNMTPLFITEVSSVSGIHTDKDSYAIGYINEPIRQLEY